MRLPRPFAKLTASIASVKTRYRDRHRPTAYRFAIAEDLEHLNVAHWEQVTAGASLFLQRAYLTALGLAPPAGVSLRYALLYREKTPVAAVACQLVAVDGQRLGLKKPLHGLRSRVLVCGNVFSWGAHGVAIAEGEDPDAIWLGVGEALYRIRRAERLSGETGMVMVKDLPEAKPPTGLQRLGFRCFATDPDMVLEHANGTRTFAAYLAAMNAKYRKAAKDTFTAIDRAGCTTETVTDLDDWAERIHALYLQVHMRAKVRLATITPTYLPTLARQLGATNFRATLIHRAGNLLGFVTTLKDRDTAVGYIIGFDDQTNDEIPLYFRLLYATVEHGLALGCRKLSLGRTALEPKAKLGAKPVPMHVAMRLRNPASNAIMRPFLRWVPHGEAPERTVFKE